MVSSLNSEALRIKMALAYRRRGWSVLPLRGKKPALRSWSEYQDHPADEETIERWFRRRGISGVGLVTGPVSGGLCVLDFDVTAAYEVWARDHEDLAEALPTVKTKRGYHVYFRADVDRIIKLDDGEIKGKGYVVAPPSLHPSGTVYDWIVPLPDGPLLEIDPFEVGLAGSYTERQRDRETEGHRRRSPSPSEALENPLDILGVEHAIASTLPEKEGERDNLIFNFARALKAVSELADAQPSDLCPIVLEWHRGASPSIGTKAFAPTWSRFVRSWEAVRWPLGAGPMQEVLERAQEAVAPSWTLEYGEPETVLLVKVARELQRASVEAPFFLSCRKAGELVGLSYKAAADRLNMLVADQVLTIEGEATQRSARRYRYRVADDEVPPGFRR